MAAPARSRRAASPEFGASGRRAQYCRGVRGVWERPRQGNWGTTMLERGVMTTPIFDELLDELGVEIEGEDKQADEAGKADNRAG